MSGELFRGDQGKTGGFIQHQNQRKNELRRWHFPVAFVAADNVGFQSEKLILALRYPFYGQRYISVQYLDRERNFFITLDIPTGSLLKFELAKSDGKDALSLAVEPDLTELTIPEGGTKGGDVAILFSSLKEASLMDFCFAGALDLGPKYHLTRFLEKMRCRRDDVSKPYNPGFIFCKDMPFFQSLRNYRDTQTLAAKWEHDSQVRRLEHHFKGLAWIRFLDDQEIELHIDHICEPVDQIRLRDEQEFILSKLGTPIQAGLRLVAFPQHVEEFNFRNNLVLQPVKSLREDVKRFLRSVSGPEEMDRKAKSLEITPIIDTRPRDLILETLEKVLEAARDQKSRVDFRGIILGFNPPMNTKPCSAAVIEQLENFPLEDEQRAAALMALSPVDDKERTLITAVRGGPLTGKTYLSSVVCQVALASKISSRVLVCAPTNSALEALVESMAAVMDIKSRDGDVVYLQSRIPSTRMDYEQKNEIVTVLVSQLKLEKRREDWMEDHSNDELTLRYAKYSEKNLESRIRDVEELINEQIWDNTVLAFTTLESSLKIPRTFGATMLIIEESGRATEPQAMIPITRFYRTLERILLVGDTRHLLPYSLTDHSVIQLSFLTRLLRLGWNQFSQLRQQRGMDPAISSAVQKLWYNGRIPLKDLPPEYIDDEVHLKVAVREMNYLLCDHPGVSGLPKRGFYRKIIKNLFGFDDVGFWINIRGEEKGREKKNQFESKSNLSEALAIRRMYCVLIKSGVSPQDVAILTPYSAQRQWLTKLLADEIDDGLSVSTFEEYQLHRDVVFISLVRSNGLYKVGFLDDWNRLCAGFIHARYVQIIFGDYTFMKLAAEEESIYSYEKGAVDNLVNGSYKWRVLEDPSGPLYMESKTQS
ncbi:Regulator of nonsense transcripts 1-like protein [Arthrobotrys musiformis]|uniref:Regulator of nonsense transcripts 1-like protein n=1 Tax=Arthrobotrys musiformis TaxID=47236 RepID=A0AAV9WCK1_9PEZI